MNATPGFIDPAFIQVTSGACVDLHHPDVSAITPKILAHQLARIGRWAGATQGDRPYSVAQHTVLVLQAILDSGCGSAITARAALLHDAPEIITGDLTAPVKRLAGPAFAELETRLEAAFARRFAQPFPLVPADAALVRWADLTALATERRDLLAGSQWAWGENLPPPLLERITPWPTMLAEAQLANQFRFWGVI